MEELAKKSARTSSGTNVTHGTVKPRCWSHVIASLLGNLFDNLVDFAHYTSTLTGSPLKTPDPLP